jgi:hypothetical protein
MQAFDLDLFSLPRGLSVYRGAPNESSILPRTWWTHTADIAATYFGRVLEARFTQNVTMVDMASPNNIRKLSILFQLYVLVSPQNIPQSLFNSAFAVDEDDHVTRHSEFVTDTAVTIFFDWLWKEGHLPDHITGFGATPLPPFQHWEVWLRDPQLELLAVREEHDKRKQKEQRLNKIAGMSKQRRKQNLSRIKEARIKRDGVRTQLVFL